MFRSRAHAFLLAAALFFIVLPVLAQNGNVKAKVLLYKDRIAAQWDTVDCVKNVIKINPLLFFRGEIPIYFEHAISQRVSMEIGAGVTYRNYLHLTFAGDDADDFGAGTKIIPKPAFHLGARYYFKDELEPDGAYLQVEFAYLDYAKDISAKDSSGFTGVTYHDERVYNDVRLYYGYQLLGSSSNWLFDLYGGVALRSRHLDVVHENVTFNERGKALYDYKVDPTTDLVPAFFLGVKVGVGF
jgi:hypothetical protein